MVDDADDDDGFLTPSKVASERSGYDGKYITAVAQFAHLLSSKLELAHLLSSKLAPSLTPHAASAGGSLCEKVRGVFSGHILHACSYKDPHCIPFVIALLVHRTLPLKAPLVMSASL